MKAQILYDAQNDGVISGEDMQEFFSQVTGKFSISGNAKVPTTPVKNLMRVSLDAQERNSPSMAGWCEQMRRKYGL